MFSKSLLPMGQRFQRVLVTDTAEYDPFVLNRKIMGLYWLNISNRASTVAQNSTSCNVELGVTVPTFPSNTIHAQFIQFIQIHDNERHKSCTLTTSPVQLRQLVQLKFQRRHLSIFRQHLLTRNEIEKVLCLLF